MICVRDRVPASDRPSVPERRQVLGLLGRLGALGTLGVLLPRLLTDARRAAQKPAVPQALSLREADFYRPHDLAD